jgi:hypothetical protein
MKYPLMKNQIRKLLEDRESLKAREIAKLLKKERSDVNSFLYKNKHLFYKNSKHEWSLFDNEKTVIELAPNWGWLDSYSFEKTIKSTIGESVSVNKNIEVIIPKDCKILLVAAARLLSLINQLIYDGVSVTVDLNDCSGTRGYLNRIGFFEHLNKKAEILPKWPKFPASKIYQGDSTTLVEFGSIDPDKINKSLINQLTERFVQQSNEGYRVAAFTIFSELIGNVREHSESPIFGFAALQKYKSSKGRSAHIQTVVSDSGLGIAQTLRPALETHHPVLYEKYKTKSVENDIELVIKTLQTGGISRFGTGRGLGFRSSREQANKFNAELSVRQDTYCLNFNFEGDKLASLKRDEGLANIRGTHICFDFFIDK